MRGSVKGAVGDALGSAVVSASAAHGGSINESFTCGLADGRRVFVKSNDGCDPTMFALEARGLQWLAATDAVRVPEVLAVNIEGAAEPFLVLELIEPGRRAADFDAILGRQLATLHQSGAPSFGLEYPNFLATLSQDNTPAGDWPTFYARRRLAPQIRLAVDSGHGPRSWIARMEAIAARLEQLTGPPEPPARLHGDLWSGNVHCDEHGAPVLIDPAVYGGHREIDLAMLQLFGSPSPGLFQAYDEVYPLADGYRERIPLYQLYPLLAHVNLFGGGYVGQANAALSKYV